MDSTKLLTATLSEKHDYLAPDSSEIRLLPETIHGGLAHCTLPAGRTSKAVKHKTVYEIWYVLEGNGEIWRKNDSEESTVKLIDGTAVTIPVNTMFQFRNTGNSPLKILIATMPPWPGKEEAVEVDDHWGVN